MRGGLDDALERLARRDRLRHRSAQRTGGTPPEVTELVEAVAAVVARHPDLAVTMGVEGVGSPVLLHFEIEGGIVRVDAEDPLAGPASQRAVTTPLEADVEISFDLEGEARPTNVNGDIPPRSPVAPQPGPPVSHDPATDPEAGRPSGPPPVPPTLPPTLPAIQPERTQPEPTTATAAADDVASTGPSVDGASTPNRRRSHPAAYRLPEGRPVPFHVQPEETQQAAKRLAAMLREDPSLLQPMPPD